MKSFNQFLNESYFSEEIPTGMSRDEFNRLPSKSKSKLTGSKLGIGNKGQTLNTSQNAPAVRRARNLNTPVSSVNSGKLPIPNPPKPPTSTSAAGGKPPTGTSAAGGKPPTSTPPSGGKPPTSTPPSGGKPPTGTPPTGGKPPTGTPPTGGKPPTAPKVPGRFAKIGRLAGPASAAIDTAMSTADERSKGSGCGRSLAKGATVAAGGLLGGTAGAIGGGGLLSAATGTAGALAGGAAAGKAFDVAAGANAKERKGMATANRQRQAGTSVKGIGGSTSFSQKKPGGPAFMSTGVGKQRKTAQLAKTGVVQRGGQSVAGNLAFKKGQAVYKAGPSAKSLAKTSSNPLERVGRSLFAGAYKKFDAANAAKKLATARSSDSARSRKLGVKKLPGK
jgi:hypothetical protein